MAVDTADKVDAKPAAHKADVETSHALLENKKPGADAPTTHQDRMETAGGEILSGSSRTTGDLHTCKEAFNRMSAASTDSLPACSVEGRVDQAAFKPGEQKAGEHGHEFNIPGKDGKDPLHVAREGDTMTVTRDGETYKMNRQDGTHSFADNKGNSMEMGRDGQLHAKVDGEDYSISRDEIRQQFHGSRVEMINREHNADDPSKTKTDTLVTKPASETDDTKKISVSDNTGEIRTTAEQDGKRVFHVHGQGETQDKETVAYNTKDKTLTLHNPTDGDNTQNDKVLQAKDGKWVNPATGNPYTDAELKGMTINGRQIAQGQDIRISGNGQTTGADGTTIGLDGNVQTTVNGQALTIKAAEAGVDGNAQQKVTAVLQKENGGTTEITNQGNLTTTTDCDANNACAVSKLGPAGSLDVRKQATNPADGTPQTNLDGTPVLQASDFRFNPGSTDGKQPALASLGPSGSPEASFMLTQSGSTQGGYDFGAAYSGDLGLTNGSWNGDPSCQWQMGLNTGWSTGNDWSSWSDPSGQTAYGWNSSTGYYSTGYYSTATDGYSYSTASYSQDETGLTFATDNQVAATEGADVQANAMALVSSADDGTPDTSKQASLEADRASLEALLRALPASPQFDGIRERVSNSLALADQALSAANNQKDRLAMAEQAAMDGAPDSEVQARAYGLNSGRIQAIRDNDETGPDSSKKREAQLLSA